MHHVYPKVASIAPGGLFYQHRHGKPISFALVTILCDESPSSSNTGRNSGTYLNTVVRLCKNVEGFTLETPTDILAAILEEVRGHEKSFLYLFFWTGLCVPIAC